MTSLSYAQPGYNYEIKWMLCPSEDDYEEFCLLQSMGFVPGISVYLLQSFLGNVIVMLGGRRIMLGDEAASLIKV